MLADNGIIRRHERPQRVDLLSLDMVAGVFVVAK
jgi:hypothetical protein